MDNNASGNVPQFATAEYHPKSGENQCRSCGRDIVGSFYKVNGAPTCAACAAKIQAELAKDSPAAFGRALIFGIGGAVLGAALYVTFALLTGLIAGIISLAVGYLVGKAIMQGSGGIGGRRYQIAAVLLTYMAVSLAAVPISLSHYYKQHAAEQQSPQAPPTSPAPARPAMSFARAVGTLTMIGLASPFLALNRPAQGAIGLVILFVGLRIAWRITAGQPVSLTGPLRDNATATTG